MSHDGYRHAAMAASTVSRRFWLLIVVVFVLAIGASSYALQKVAVPSLADYQKRVVEKQSRITAQRLNSWLEQKRLLVEVLARDATIQASTLGYNHGEIYFRNAIDALPVTESLAWVSLFGTTGEVISDKSIRGEREDMFSPEQYADLVEATAAGPSLETPILLRREGDGYFLAFTTPVLFRDSVHGVLVSGYIISRDDFFVASDISKDAFLLTNSEARAWENRSDIEFQPLTSLPIVLGMEPDVAVVEAAGKQLITSGVSAIAFVLVTAFGLFALLGRAVIVTPHQRLEEQAMRLEAQKKNLTELAAIAERAGDSIVVRNLDGSVRWANPSFETLTGFSASEVTGKTIASFLYGPETDPKAVELLSNAIAERRSTQVEMLIYRKTGEPIWVRIGLSPFKNEAGEVDGFVAVANDTTEHRESKEALIHAKKAIEQQALHDPLTGLPNRRALDQALQERVNDTGEETTLVRIDLDHFKYVNDTLGHDAGDFVLKEVAHILQTETKQNDLAVRVGGDEFVLLLGPSSTAKDGAQLAKRILDRIKVPKRFDGKIVRVGASFGVASIDDNITDHKSLVVAADAALYEAKEAGRNRVHLYTPNLHRAVLERRDLSRELRRGLNQGEFEPFYQPQVDAETGEIVGVETLARWNSSSFGLVLPARFLPAAKQLSILEEIDNQIFAKAIAQISGLRKDGLHVPKLSVNVTAHRIKDAAVHKVINALPEDGPKIAFEVLESVLVEEQSSRFQFGLDLLRERGVEIEVDDFGSGHASIVGLMQLRPDAMKIDQRLVAPIIDDELARGVLDRIVSMAELMDLTVVAEGVETAEHARILGEIGCHVLQGYHFCRPMPLDDLRRFISRWGVEDKASGT